MKVMPMRHSSLLKAAFVCAAFASMAPRPAAAAITCEGNFQVQANGNRIATPYCADGYLAQVAREYGMRVSAQEIRWNPNEKGRVCRFIGDDNRVRDTCNNYRNDDFNRWR
jgi:hypothetical protein